MLLHSTRSPVTATDSSIATARHAERQAIYENDMLPDLRSADFDAW